MTDWTDIHQDFTKELKKKWKELRFNRYQVQEWIENACLEPADAEFAFWLKNNKDYTPDEIDSDEIEELRDSYNNGKLGSEINSVLLQAKTKQKEKDWKNINSNFTPELIQKWKDNGFTYEECTDWINIHAPNDQNQAIQEPEFYAYLRDEIKLKPEEVLSDNSADLVDLREHFREYEQRELEAKIELFPKQG
ncbi:hypothetical protein [endosymbiont GvMRE of Glomus versiforme]|uniref:hypothetical protein n=1 Tax=endosymbiont GvMRE of Glomus versiforme TaxID=2039283 RepID=UPI000ED73317|nr:hypothetical protein [endosymbiont GvMRE of Glomus versiforme]RHZ36484.1 Serine/threonine protein kinase [endosymbiont GvMRE of Glomus versiforme]